VTVGNRPVTRGAQGAIFPCKIFRPSLEKCVGHILKLLDIVKKIWVLLRKLFAPLGVSSWLWVWWGRRVYFFFWGRLVFPYDFCETSKLWHFCDLSGESFVWKIFRFSWLGRSCAPRIFHWGKSLDARRKKRHRFFLIWISSKQATFYKAY